MISLNNVTVAYGSFTLLDDVSVHISAASSARTGPGSPR